MYHVSAQVVYERMINVHYYYYYYYQYVTPPCTDQKRGPDSRFLLDLIPGRPFAPIGRFSEAGLLE